MQPFLQVELPVPILRRINLLEVVTDGSVDELGSGVDWAVRRTDIALWCTQTFDEKERAVWGRVPDSLKDHAFLVLTKADVLSAEKVLSKRVADLETMSPKNSIQCLPSQRFQAVRAFSPGGIDETMFHASGGGALTSEVLRHAERGRRADFDSAHMFLARYQVQPGPKAVPAGDKEKPVPVEDASVEEASVEEAPDEEVSVEEAPVAVQEPVEVPIDTPPRVQNVELFTDAVRFLRRRADGLAETAGSLSEGETKPIINQCVDAVEHLTDLFSQDESGCEAADAFIDELAEATDVMVLMQVEDGDAPAADAVTLLLQLRHDMEMQLAA